MGATATAIEIQGGTVEKITTLTDSPVTGIFIIDHDNLCQEVIDIALEEAIRGSFRPVDVDGIQDYKSFRAEVEATYGVALISGVQKLVDQYNEGSLSEKNFIQKIVNLKSSEV
jgi:hypothetical protein